jgi:hypothetical protein
MRRFTLALLTASPGTLTIVMVADVLSVVVAECMTACTAAHTHLCARSCGQRDTGSLGRTSEPDGSSSMGSGVAFMTQNGTNAVMM